MILRPKTEIGERDPLDLDPLITLRPLRGAESGSGRRRLSYKGQMRLPSSSTGSAAETEKLAANPKLGGSVAPALGLQKRFRERYPLALGQLWKPWEGEDLTRRWHGGGCRTSRRSRACCQRSGRLSGGLVAPAPTWRGRNFRFSGGQAFLGIYF